jgi:polyisoprenoid-binding protein YceI
VPLAAGRYTFGPENATLSVRTGRSGAAAKAGHDLLLHVTVWEATLDVAEGGAEVRVELDADSTSFRVREGTGGMQALGDDDKANIEQTINDEVLRRMTIGFHSTAVEIAGGGDVLHVQGELTLAAASRPVAFDLTVGADGSLRAAIKIKQTEWGIKPYSALFGALKVADEVEIDVSAAGAPADQSR